MKHISDALNALHEHCAWFARAHELRLLVVRTSGDLRKTATKLIPRYEFHADNRSPWVLLEDAFSPGERQWQSRATRLLQNWEQRREAFARENSFLPAATVPDAPVRSSPVPGLASFLGACVAVLEAVRSPLEGLVVVLAPAIVDELDALDADLSALLVGAPELHACRVVLVLDIDMPLPQFVINELGEAAMACECVTDPGQKRRDLHALVKSAGDNTAPTAGAWPIGVVAPRRPNAPPDVDPAVRDAALRAAGIEPAYLEHAPALRQLILGAALAMGEGRHDEAIELQANAVRLSQQVGMPQLMVICLITHASYLSAAGNRQRALEELNAAAQRAAKHALPEQESQAQLARGLLFMLERRPLDAADAYYRSALSAESADSGILAIEGWRLAGQAALAGGATETGVQYLKHALHLAGSLEPEVRANTSAPEVARSLAKVYADAGYGTHAQALHAQADALEQPAVVVAHSTAPASEETPSTDTIGT